MRTQTFGVNGMHCASCAATIERLLKKIEGVQSAEAHYATETVKVSFDETKIRPHHLSKQIEPLGYSLVISMASDMEMLESEYVAHIDWNRSRREKRAEIEDARRKVLSILPLAVFSILLMMWEFLTQLNIVQAMPYLWQEFFHHLLPMFATYTLFVVGKPYLLGFYRFLRYGKANMDTLIGIGTSAAFLYSFIITAFQEALRPYINVDHSYYDVTIVVIMFITLGKYLEMRSKIRTSDAIEKLLTLQAKTARVIRNDQEMEIPIQEVVIGDLVMVNPASRIPVDGIIVDGSSFIDESMLTGEPMPIEKQKGDTVAAGTMNTHGACTVRATKVGSETMLAHIIKMVEDAQGSKAPIQGLADKISSVFVPIVILLSCVAMAVWLIFGVPVFGFAQALSYGVVSFVSILVIACPCALGLATPTAIIVGVGKGAQEGILIKDAATLEKLHTVTTVIVDKTGTITKGKPELVSVDAVSDMDETEIVRVLASLEVVSEHPIAYAILSYAHEHHFSFQKATGFEMMQGRGVKGTVDGIEYFAGNVKLLADLCLAYDMRMIITQTAQGKTPVFLATKEKLMGIVMVADALKHEAKEAVDDLHALGINVVMLTGDDKNTAQAIADQVGIDEVVAEVLPQDKMDHVKSWQAKGGIVAMVGDGVNDAPALAQADVGIAMATGTDVAIASAGITLLGGDISKLVKAIRLSRFTMRGIKQNLFWAFIYNVIGIPLAGGLFYPFFGWLLNPIFAGLAMAFSSISVVSNSLRLKMKTL